MPFHFSARRTSGAPMSRGRILQYERTPASTFRYQAVCNSLDMMSYIIIGFWHAFVISLFMKYYTKVLSFVATSTKSTYIPLKITEMVPLSIPDIGLCFQKGVRMTPEITDRLNKYGGTNSTRIISNRKSWNVNICYGILPEDLQFFLGLRKYVDPTYRGSARIITPHQLENYLNIMSCVSVQLLAVRNCFYVNGDCAGDTFGVFSGDITGKKEAKAVLVKDPSFTDTPINLGKEVGINILEDEEEYAIAHSSNPDHRLSTAWGTMDKFKTDVGLALPFSTDISMPDRGGIASMVSRNVRLLDKNTADEDAPPLNVFISNLDKDWREGIMSTIQGEWIAHICACLELAIQVHASIFCVIKNGRYNGCILGGGKYFIMSHGEVYTPHSGNDFEKEKLSIDAHQATLSKVLELLKMPEGTKEPMSLRELRAMINPDNYDGETMNKVSELLPDLDFGIPVTPINLTTMKEVFSLLTLDDPIVDKKRYMDPEAFWHKDKVLDVLSMFGRRAPVLSTGQTLRKLSIIAKGVGSTTVPNYDSKPPSVLQLANRPLASAVETWKGLLRSGMAKGNWELEVRGNIVFKGSAKTELWTHMNDCLYKVLAKGEQSDSSVTKRARSEEGEVSEDEGIHPPPKKTQKSFSFF